MDESPPRNTKPLTIAIIAILALVLIGAGWLLMEDGTTDNTNTNASTNMAPSGPAPAVVENANVAIAEPEPEDSPYRLLAEVAGCADPQRDQSETRSTSSDVVAPAITVSGNTITYTRGVNHNCCKDLFLEKGVQNTTIFIQERWSGAFCRCDCYSQITAQLENVPPGTYTVRAEEIGDSDGGSEGSIILEQDITVQ